MTGRLPWLFFNCLTVVVAETYCDAPSEVQAELRRAAAVWDAGLTGAQRTETRRAILEALVKRFPDDIQATRRFQNDAGVPNEELLAMYRKRRDARPGDGLATYFYALVVAKNDAPEGMKLFQAALDQDPSLAWPHMGLAYYYASGALADKAKTTGQVDAFFTKCPTSYDFYTNRMLGTHATPALRKKVTEALRQRVEAETDPEKFGIYEHLWTLEFKSTAPAEHPGLRSRVAADVRRIRTAAGEPPLAMLRVMRDGLRQAGDAQAAVAMEDEMIRRFPASPEAPRLVQERWRKEHPEPGAAAAAEERRAYARRQYQAAGEWIERWPQDSIARLSRFLSAREIKDLTAEEMKAAADGLLNLLRGNDVLQGFRPFEHDAAEEYLRRNIYVDLVPGLAEEGLVTVERRVAEHLKDASIPPQVVKMVKAPLPAARMAAVALIAEAKLRLQQSDGSLEKRLAGVEPVEPEERAAWMRAASHVAALERRGLDAFVYWEKALELMPKVEPEQRERLRSLWTAAGGTDRTWAMRSERKVQEVKSATAWAKPEKAIPAAWQLVDITGKKWRSDQLAGKTVLVNVWATWCGPCRAEHPHFQKLYEKLKGREDVVVVSFNVDEQVGMVQGYLSEGKYTFPVLLAEEFVERNVDVVSIPQNWLFDGQGRHRLTQLGFMEAPGWEAGMLKAIEEVSGAAQ